MSPRLDTEPQLVSERASQPLSQGQPLSAPVEAPVSRGQRALWLLQQLSPATGAYNLVYAVRIRGRIDLPAFQRAFLTIAERHDTLRTTFVERDGEPVRLIHSHMEGYFEVADAQAWSETAFRDRLNIEVYRPFDMARGPLVRLVMLKRAPQEWAVLLAMHHSVTDLWSFAVFLYELRAFYEEETMGVPANVRAPRADYTDFVEQQEAMLSGPEGEALWEYWRDELEGDLPPLALLTDHPRPPRQTYEGAAETLLLDASLTQDLRALSEAQGVPLHVVMLAAFQTLLHRYTGQADICVGLPKASRTARFGRSIGYFVNPVVLRARFAGDPCFSDLLTEVSESVEGASAHDGYPFSLLVERLQPARDLSRPPLYQVMFAWQKTTRVVSSQVMASFATNQSGKAMQMGDLVMELLPLEQRVVPFDLSLWVAEIGEELGVLLEYSTDLFESQTMTRMLGHLQRLLQGIVEDAGRPVSGLPLVTERERQTLLFDWNDIRRLASLRRESSAVDRLVPDFVEAQAERAPDALAIACQDRRVAYGDLTRGANRLAHYLQRLGLGPGSRVGLCMERSPEMIVGLLGILKTGATYLPLDPVYPPERMSFILGDAQVKTVLTQTRLVERLVTYDVRLIPIDDTPQIAQHPATAFECPATADDAAYVIYTSGSTGEPKGVLVSYGVITDHCLDMIDYYHLTPQDRMLQFASINFDASLEQILPELMAGSALVLRDEAIWTPSEFYRNVREYRITLLNFPPAYWHQMAVGWTPDFGEEGLSQVRLAIIGGDVMQPETLRLWRKTPLGDARLLNAYGPTEATITATTFEVPSDFDHPHRIPIGRPLANRRAYVLDAHQQPVPVGVPGELYLGGGGVALGYLHRPELTAERFVANPFVDRDRLYKTGDLVRYLHDGTIEFLGRVDTQVKVRGFRIELGEIEAALLQHPKVRDVAVIMRDEVPRNRRLVGYVVPKDGVAPDPRALGDFLRARIPPYMVPAAFVFLDALPMSSSAKVDRQALPAPTYKRDELGADYVAPATPIEKGLAEIWTDVLELPSVGTHDDFFDLGGHSLLATQIASRVREQYQVELPLRTLFDSPTVAGLAIAIAQGLAEQESPEEIEALLAELEGLSESEVQSMLDGESSHGA